MAIGNRNEGPGLKFEKSKQLLVNIILAQKRHFSN